MRRDPKHNQKIVHQTSADGIRWGKVVDDVAIGAAERPGMPVVARMGNGKYIMSWECVCGGTIYTSVKTASDPESWNATDAGSKISGSGGTPYIAWTPFGGPKGTLVQSSNGSNNIFINRAYGAPGSVWTPIPATVGKGYSRSFVILSDSNTVFEISPVLGSNGYNNIVYGAQLIPRNIRAQQVTSGRRGRRQFGFQERVRLNNRKRLAFMSERCHGMTANSILTT